MKQVVLKLWQENGTLSRNGVIYNTEVVKSNICDYNDAYILVKGDITIAARNPVTNVAFKNCESFIKCITKIDGTTIDDVEDLDLVTLMYNLLEYNRIILARQVVYSFIPRMSQTILMLILRILIILNYSSLRLN